MKTEINAVDKSTDIKRAVPQIRTVINHETHKFKYKINRMYAY